MTELIILVIAIAFAIHEINYLFLICALHKVNTKKVITCANKKIVKQILKSLGE